MPAGRVKQIRHAIERVVHGLESFAPHVLPIRPNRGVAGEVRSGDRVVRYYRHWPDDPKFIADWDQLSRTAAGATTFQSPHWQRGTASVADAMGRLRVVTVHAGDRLVGVAPMERQWGGHWTTLGQFITQYDEPLIDPEDAAATWAAFFRALPQFDPKLRSVTFEAFSPDAPAKTLAPPIAQAAGYGGGEIPTHLVDVAADLPGDWEAYLASLKRNTRSKVRSRVRKIDESDRAQYVIADTEPTVMAVLPKVLNLMERDGGVKGRRTKWLFRPHLKLAAAPLARDGRLTVHQLLVDEELAAGLINLPLSGRELMWNTAMDDRFREWSPGYALNGLAVRHTIQRGCRVFDFLRGMMDYKRELGGTERPMHRLRFRR